MTESSRSFDFLRSHSSRLRYQTTDVVVKESRSYFNLEIDFRFHILIRKYFLGPTCVGRCLTMFSFLSLLFFVRLCCLREIQKYILTQHLNGCHEFLPYTMMFSSQRCNISYILTSVILILNLWTCIRAFSDQSDTVRIVVTCAFRRSLVISICINHVYERERNEVNVHFVSCEVKFALLWTSSLSLKKSCYSSRTKIHEYWRQKKN